MESAIRNYLKWWPTKAEFWCRMTGERCFVTFVIASWRERRVRVCSSSLKTQRSGAG